jgi:hypothetical protein
MMRRLFEKYEKFRRKETEENNWSMKQERQL